MRLLSLLVLAASLCSAANVTVAVSPISATITYGQAITLTAKVSGKGNQRGVTWSANAGTFSAANATSATWVPPIACGTAVITATALSDSNKRSVSTITVTQISPLTVSPAHVVLAPGASVKFTAWGGCPAKF